MNVKSFSVHTGIEKAPAVHSDFKALVVVCVENIPSVQDQLERKVERKRTCIAPIVSISTTKRSDMDHTELPANTPHLPFLRISIH